MRDCSCMMKACFKKTTQGLEIALCFASSGQRVVHRGSRMPEKPIFIGERVLVIILQ